MSVRRKEEKMGVKYNYDMVKRGSEGNERAKIKEDRN